MADKEATVFVIDTGAATGQTRPGTSLTELDFALQYVWDKLTSIIATGRKTLCVGLVTFKTDETTNRLVGEHEEYQNICELQPIKQITLGDIRALRDSMKPSKTSNGDALSATVVALEMLAAFNPKQNWRRQVILVTSSHGSIDDSGFEDIVDRFKEIKAYLTVLEIDMKDQEQMDSSDQDGSLQKRNQALLRRLADDCDGMHGSIGQAVRELTIPHVKTKRSTPIYRGTLNLGDPTVYDSAMTIDIERFIKTMIEKPPTASTFVENIPSASSHETEIAHGEDQKQLSNTKSSRWYSVKSESGDGRIELKQEDLSRGYEYGRTIIPISESDESVTKLETHAGMDIVGFIPRESYHHHMNMTRACVTVAQRTNEKAVMALSSFIHTLFETDNLAIARLVTRDGRAPELLILTPCIEPDFEGLLDVGVPFAEDVRPYKFPPLNQINLVSGRILKEHRNLPTPELRKAMSEFVDAMDLDEAGQDEDGSPSEYMTMDEVYSPTLHRTNQAIRRRAVDQNQGISAPDSELVKYSRPPDFMLQNAEKALMQLQEVANVKPVPARTLSRRLGGKHVEKPNSGLDVKSLLADRNDAQGHQIHKTNAIPEFRQMLQYASDNETVNEAFHQIGTIAEKLISTARRPQDYDRAVEALQVMRQEAVEYEFPQLFNESVQSLKRKLLADELGTGHRSFLSKLQSAELEMIVQPKNDTDNGSNADMEG